VVVMSKKLNGISIFWVWLIRGVRSLGKNPVAFKNGSKGTKKRGSRKRKPGPQKKGAGFGKTMLSDGRNGNANP